ncbi:Phosphoglycolate phosphatase [uncultured archaeon]|nr:Phosphoglycolate phosphatase [uncultured archaeon]
MIKAIFLDFEGVLTTEGSIVRNILYPKLKEYATLDELRKMYEDARCGKLSLKEAFAKIPLEELLKTADEIKAKEGATRALSEIENKYPLFLASNHTPELFERAIKNLGIKKFFKRIFVSFEMKAAKPDKKFFEIMLKETGYSPSECVFVDDSKTNLLTAKEMGFVTIWFNNKDDNSRNKIEFDANYEVRTIKELTSLIKKL